MKNYTYIYWLLNTLPIWATALILYMVTMGMIFFLRDRYEGLFYNTSYSAMLGDGALIVAVLMATEMLKRGASLPYWAQAGGYQFVVGVIGLALGLVWYTLDAPEQWGDCYHHIVIAPMLCYLGITLLPVVAVNGNIWEYCATIFLIATWLALVIFDASQDRLNQRRWIQGQEVTLQWMHKP